MIGLFFLALSLDPTTETLLNEAQSALSAGNKAEDDAIRQRLAAHIEWDDCIKNEAARFAHLQEPLETLAEAVLGMCLDQETRTRVRASDVARRLEGLEGAKLRDDVEKTVQGWRRVQKQSALAILARSRLSR